MDGIMGYIDRHINSEEFPFYGRFFVRDGGNASSDGDMFGEVQESENVILETKCDVAEANRMFANGAATAIYDVYFPLGDDMRMPIDRGMNFDCDCMGLHISGMVIGAGVSQMGKAHATVRCTDI